MANGLMKKAKFITCPDYTPCEIKSPWPEHFYNNKSADIPDENNVLSFVRDFSVCKKVKKAVVRATSLGVFEMFLNGERIGENGVYDELKPTNTDCRCHLFVYSYDITAALCGDNRFTAVVAPGWRSGRISFGFYGLAEIALCAEIEIAYEDGETEIIATDESFLSTLDGPDRTADIWDGWRYDARVSPVYESTDGKKLSPAKIVENVTAELIAPIGESVRVDDKLTRTPLTATVHRGTVDNGTDFGRINILSRKAGSGCEKTLLKKGESIILDLGQNMVGRPHFEIKAPAGTVIRGYVAELLNDSGIESRGNDGPEGSMYIKNYRSAGARVYYIAKGGEAETVYPLHVFYGFRYYEITADADIELLSFRGLVMKSDLAETGTFSCSDAEVNRLFSNILWGARGNYLSVPTDCPQRDERLGWTGDTEIFAGAGSYLLYTNDFFTKWLADARDSQKGYNGAYCCVIPRVFTNEGGNAAWADAGIIVPDVMYEMFGNTDILKVHFESMCDYMDYIYKKNGLDGPNTAYGDWLNYEHTDKRYIAVCYHACDARLMVKFCGILAKAEPEKAAYYLEKKAFFENRLAEIKAHFLKKYYSDGNLNEDMRTQTTYLLALHFDLIPAQDRERCIDCLRKKIVDNDYTLSTGFVGTGVLAQTLQEVGLSDLAYDLLLQTKDPSWLYSVRQGATTVWERWNSYTKETGFGDVGMNSFNHYAYGAVAQWMFDGICGILPDAENGGFKKFRLFPTPDLRTFIPAGQDRMTHAEATYLSRDGEIRSSWRTENGTIVYSFTVPEGTSATVGILRDDKSAVIVNDAVFTADQLGAQICGDRLCFTLGAGEYTVK